MDIIDKGSRKPPGTLSVHVSRHLDWGDLKAALAAGWADYRAAPQFGLFFAGIYVAAGLALAWALATQSAVAWLVPAAAGFPLLAPFCAVGLYEVSRCRETLQPLRWGGVLSALRGRGDDQILSMGVIIFVAFGFWLMIAHAIFAIFQSGSGTDSLAFLLTGTGLVMLAFGSAVGALLALGFYAVTVVSLPMLVDRDVDFMTAIIASLSAMRQNGVVLLGWAVLIAAALFIAMLPAFLGLLVVLPVLGHATWHLYRRLVA
ncbi:DUF2189 domain-containing protein [Sandarakinorhabdus sp. AAP62]|uniref:DUF2189 domain-containing protein n=1 Tax=Sandarakinorhabdus sp. AAP62 TaxID=1248916 RepID=UPI0002F55EC7|nr:DUF2189 domain-containing protein [Sandarakinorhabdus sp. AAP62]